MNNRLVFVIYGAASDIISPLYEEFSESEFICLVNSSVPNYATGKTINTNSIDWCDSLKETLLGVDRSKTLVYLNAATYQVDKLFISMTENEMSKMIDVGISLHLRVTQTVVASMVSRRSGRVINLSSFRSKTPASGTAIYSAIKSFGNTLYRTIALEYGRFDITSNSILIGFAESKLLDSLSDESTAKLKRSVAKKKFLPQSEFVRCVSYLIESSYVTGSEIELDGGLKYLEP